MFTVYLASARSPAPFGVQYERRTAVLPIIPRMNNSSSLKSTYARSLLVAACASLGACAATRVGPIAPPSTPAAAPRAALRTLDPQDARTRALREQVKTIVIIYAENRAFDDLYGNFPGARGLSEVIDHDGHPLPAYRPQRDRDGSVLPRLPQTWGGVTAPGYTPVVTQAESGGLPNAPFSIERSFGAPSGISLSTSVVTRDLYHRFFEHQMQIDGGANDGYAAWSDAGGLTMGHYDTSHSELFALAQHYVLADNFFQGAFGGSFLNHQYLICACAPEYPHADTVPAKPSIAILERDKDGHFTPRLRVANDGPASALDGPPKFAKSGNIAPADYFGDGKFYAINTMQPPYQPSGNVPATSDQSLQYANPDNPTTLPPQTQTTIGDRLDAAGVAWSWYSSAPRTAIYAPATPAGNPDFQPHHQPFNYYERFDPATRAAARAKHLKDYDTLLADIATGKLPPVVFYKPQGNLNQHPGYASIDDGDAHIAALIRKLQASPQWNQMIVVVTYDEYGGAWDHVAPPHGDLLGPGARIPALIISPLAKQGSVDHTQYDTESILRLITRRYGLEPLPGMIQRDRALTEHGEQAMGDLTEALRF
jgi:acid phosphatase